MKIYAVLDTNVLVSALIKQLSVPAVILEYGLNGDLQIVLNDQILSEYEDVLLRPKFHFDKYLVHNLLSEIKRKSLWAEGIHTDEVFPDLKDVMFYEVVMDVRQTDNAYLVTGNGKHFPQKPFIVTPREMLDIMINYSNSSEMF